jgi:hypothetical protein
MKKKIGYYILTITLVFVLIGTVSAQPGLLWQSSEWEATGFNNGVRMVRDSNGYFHAFWHSQGTSGAAPNGLNCDIYYSYTTVPAMEPPSMAFLGRWAIPVNLTTNLHNRDNRYPSVAIEYQNYDSTGSWHNYNKIHLVWQALLPNGTRYEVLYANLSIGNPPGAPPAWPSAKDLSNTLSTDSLVPAIAINKYGPTVTGQHLHVVWQEEDIFSGGLAPPQEDAWYSDIAYIRSKDSGLNWAGPAGGWGGNVWDNLTQTATNSQMPTIACIQDQYTRTPAGNPGDLGYNSDDVHVAYNENVGANINVFYKRSPNDGVSWNPRVNVTTATSTTTQYDAYPNITVDMKDNPHLVFMRNKMQQREPLRTGAAVDNYLPGVNPSLWKSFPGPEIGMYCVLPNSITYAYYNGVSWTSMTWNPAAKDFEFPTVGLDRWQHVNVNWQEYYIGTNDYEITRYVNINLNPPQYPLVLQNYQGWGGINDSNDTSKDDLFPNLAGKKIGMYRSPNESPVAGYDEIWTKINGHGAGAAIAGSPKNIMQDGNMKLDPSL